MGLSGIIYPNQITLIFPGEPRPKQSTRFTTKPFTDKKGKLHYSYQDPKVKAAENTIAWTAVQQLPGGFIPWDCGVVVIRALFVFPIPSGMSKSERQVIAAGGIVYKTTKPDMDNLCKCFFDGLNHVLFTDDGRICHIKESMKIYGTNPRAEFVFEPLKQNP